MINTDEFNPIRKSMTVYDHVSSSIEEERIYEDDDDEELDMTLIQDRKQRQKFRRLCRQGTRKVQKNKKLNESLSFRSSSWSSSFQLSLLPMILILVYYSGCFEQRQRSWMIIMMTPAMGLRMTTTTTSMIVVSRQSRTRIRTNPIVIGTSSSSSSSSSSLIWVGLQQEPQRSRSLLVQRRLRTTMIGVLCAENTSSQSGGGGGGSSSSSSSRSSNNNNKKKKKQKQNSKNKTKSKKITENNNQEDSLSLSALDDRYDDDDSEQKVILSEGDLADHVSNLYLNGPGSSLRHKLSRTRRRQQHMTPLKKRRTTTTSSAKTDSPSTSDSSSTSTSSSSTSTSTESTSVSASSVSSHMDHLHMLDRHPSLVLNADYQPLSHLPLSLWHWQEAIKSVFGGKVTVVDVYPNIIVRASSLEMPLPSVIALNEFVPHARHIKQQHPAFTKRNVFLRDEYRCQYCCNRFHTNELSLDHVVPRCLGGHLCWTNAVTCCRECNSKKGKHSIHELKQIGMKLYRQPTIPTQYDLLAVASRMVPRRVHPTWEPFIIRAQANAGTSTTSTADNAATMANDTKHINRISKTTSRTKTAS